MTPRLLPFATWLALSVVHLGSAGAPLPRGPSFRMETEMFHGDDPSPVARHKILFDAGVVYDIHAQGGRWSTVFDPTRGRVILLDAETKVQTQVATEELIKATAQLAAAAKQAEKAEAFGLQATPQALPDNSGYEIGFGALHYKMTTQTVQNPAIAEAYHQLAVWASRLNVLRKRGAPPFARMALGERVADDQRLPLHLTLTIREGLRKETFRAHHLVVERLSELDRKAIDQVGNQLAAYRKVELGEFPSDSP